MSLIQLMWHTFSCGFWTRFYEDLGWLEMSKAYAQLLDNHCTSLQKKYDDMGIWALAALPVVAVVILVAIPPHVVKALIVRRRYIKTLKAIDSWLSE